MDFCFTPDEAQSTALLVVAHFKQLGITLHIEKNILENAPLRTTLSGGNKGLLKLIEVQKKLNYKNVRELALWLGSNRIYAELIIAIPTSAVLQANILTELERDGVGLILVDQIGTVLVAKEARNHALVITPDPTLKYGKCKIEVLSAINKYNTVNRKDGLRDLCELVERETSKLIAKASRANHITLTESTVLAKDWSGQIDTLASANACNSGKSPLFDEKFKLDMHSFRGARNLFDHKVKSKRADMERLKQSSERMMQGSRIIEKLVSLQRKLK